MSRLPDEVAATNGSVQREPTSRGFSPSDEGTGAHFDAVWLLPAFQRSLDALCRRQPKTRAKIWKTLDRFLSDASELHRSPLTGSRRRVFHTRVDGEKRLIDEPLGPLHPSEVAALYVGHHDDANAWGAAYDDDTLLKLPSAERVSSDARRTQPDTQTGAGEGSTTPYDRRRTAAPRANAAAARAYGDVLTKRELEARGVPAELILSVLAAADCVDLTTLGLDADTADKVDNWYLSKLPSRVVPLHVPSADVVRPLRATREDLPAILRLPLHKFLATLTEDQRRLAERESDRLFVVRGAAGSGKTIVGIRRLEYWVRQRDLFDKRPILFTCYNKVLAHAVTQMVEDSLGQTLDAANVQVVTAFKLMSGLQRELEGRRFARLVRRSDLVPLIAEARKVVAPSAALERWNDDEILDEILEVIFARVITNEADYLAADRSGRGRERRLDRPARATIWQIGREFRARCRKRGVAPWDQLPARLVGLLERHPVSEPRYAAIVVDEAQDLPPSVLRVLLALQARDDRNVVILGDAAQNVYRNSFRWAHTGLKVAGGQVATLRRCFRSTPTIIRAATPLVERQAQRFEDDLTVPQGDGEPGPPVQVRLYSTPEAELEAVAQEIAIHIENGTPPSSIGVLLDDSTARRTLRQLLGVLDCRCEDYLKANGDKFVDIFEPSVKLLTTGSAKGIEFQILFIPGVTERQFPSSDDDGETADRARRVLYTAMTRCAWELHISSSASAASHLLHELDASSVFRESVG